MSAESLADYQVNTRYDERGETVTVRRIKPLNFAIMNATWPGSPEQLPWRRVRNPKSEGW
jgi:hypothetical protein